VRARQKQKRHEALGMAALGKGMREVSGDVRRRLKR
jgi:hypothetical protein